MTNNELSRKVLKLLYDKKKPFKFQEMVKALGVDARTVYKNLFYLEEHEYIRLSTSYPSDAVYPLIHLVRIRDKAANIVKDAKKLEIEFPLSDTSRDHYSASEPDLEGITYYQALKRLERETVSAGINEKDRRKWQRRIKVMLEHPLAKKKIARLNSAQ